MLGTWLMLLALALALWAWMDALSARERAIAYGRALCREAGVQLLDQTVALKRVRIQRIDGLPSLVRRYGFEISLDGSDRHRGQLDVSGHRLQAWSLPEVRRATSGLEPPVRVIAGN